MVKLLKKSIRLFTLIMLSAWLMNGCENRRSSFNHNNAKLPRHVAGACDRDIANLERWFNKNEVQVVTIGQDFLIKIPADNLFADQSPRLMWGSYSLLNKVVCYLKQFRIVGVTITGHVSKYISVDRERALSLSRARAVGEYLSAQDIDSRFIFTDGAGSDKPIDSISSGGDRSPNSRIEISFRRQVA